MIAPSGAEADALATALHVLPVAEGLRLVESLPEVACLIVGTDGTIARSRQLAAFERTVAPAPPPPAEGNELRVDFEIAKPEGKAAGSRYRRPYVVVWIEDPEGRTIRTVLLWVSLGGSGPERWLPDLRRWYRNDEAKTVADKKNLVFLDRSADQVAGEILRHLGRPERRRPAGGAGEVHAVHRVRPRARHAPVDPPGRDARPPALHGRAEGGRGDRVGRRSSTDRNERTRVPPTSPDDNGATARPRRRLVRNRLAGVLRWLHIYLSMLGLAAVLFFSVDGADAQPSRLGVRLGGADLGGIGGRLIPSGSIPRGSTARTTTTRRPGCGSWRWWNRCDRTTRFPAPWPDFRADGPECSVSFKGPGTFADALIDRATGRYTLRVSRRGWVAVVNDLHKGRDSGPGWSWLIDVSAVLMGVISLTGLGLLFFLKLRRGPGLVVGLVGLVVVAVVYAVFVP